MKPPPKIALLLAAALLLLAAAPCPAKEQGFTWFKESASGPDVARVVRFCREAHVRSRQGRVNQPAQALRQALVESRQNALVQLLLANAYAALNQPQAADDAQRQADAAPATIWDAELWATLLNERWMADDLRSALSRWPQNVTAHLGLALIEKSAKKYRRAAELGAFVAERQPHHPALRPLLAAIAPGLVQEAENALLEGNKPRAAGSARLILRLARAPSKDDLMWAVVRAPRSQRRRDPGRGRRQDRRSGERMAQGCRAPLVRASRPGTPRPCFAGLLGYCRPPVPARLAWPRPGPTRESPQGASRAIRRERHRRRHCLPLVRRAARFARYRAWCLAQRAYPARLPLSSVPPGPRLRFARFPASPAIGSASARGRRPPRAARRLACPGSHLRDRTATVGRRRCRPWPRHSLHSGLAGPFPAGRPLDLGRILLTATGDRAASSTNAASPHLPNPANSHDLAPPPDIWLPHPRCGVGADSQSARPVEDRENPPGPLPATRLIPHLPHGVRRRGGFLTRPPGRRPGELPTPPRCHSPPLAARAA